MKYLVKGPNGGSLIRHSRTEEECRSDFWKRVNRKSRQECWPWTGATNNGKKNGYGIVWMNGAKHRTHRYAFEISNRPLTEGEFACHSCDNPICCNPAHIFAGTPQENRLDCASKGRTNSEKGEDRYNATLTEENVLTIRKIYVPRRVGIDTLARQFGVSRSMIFAIIQRKRWKHI